jgi:hypothetical protein
MADGRFKHNLNGKNENVNINRKKMMKILQISYIPVVGVSFGLQDDIYMLNTHQRFPEYLIQTNRKGGGRGVKMEKISCKDFKQVLNNQPSGCIIIFGSFCTSLVSRFHFQRSNNSRVSPTSDTRTTSVRELHPRYAGGS